jgi:trans-2,3-dihydro-3-hydroxyanthranilate isomerase
MSLDIQPLAYHHVDVFSARPFSGNSLTVFPDSARLSSEQMLRITQEMRHFESIFLSPTEEENAVRAQIFDLHEELDFAGHPLLGAASVLHHIHDASGRQTWTFALNRKTVQVTTERDKGHYRALLDQGRPEFVGSVEQKHVDELLSAINLLPDDLCAHLPLEVVNTGLRYLIVPIKQGLERAHIVHPTFETLLKEHGAQFVYVLNIPTLEGRHWNNDGLIEDVATGSAAGTVGAYLVKHARIQPGQEFLLQQGRFTGRPSQMRVRAEGQPHDIQSVLVGGDVSLVGQGMLQNLPKEGKDE